MRLDSGKVLIFKLNAVGALRHYYSVIPTGAPQAYCDMTEELIDVRDYNKVLWRHQATISEAVKGGWDQPPSYPNISNTLKLAINSAQQKLSDSFFSGH